MNSGRARKLRKIAVRIVDSENHPNEVYRVIQRARLYQKLKKHWTRYGELPEWAA